MCAIGGYNCIELLDKLDYSIIKNNPKIIMGYSDNTALLNAIYKKTGLVTYLGPNFADFGMKYGFDYTEGYTWTTDAIYRETKDKIKYFKDNGAVCVEMEGTIIAAVCKYLDIDYFTFYYAGDNLDSAVWDERSLSGLSKLDKKKEVMTLALELSRKI